jgi:IKI3 family
VHRDHKFVESVKFLVKFSVQMMAVGWGKKETQFQGSAGKQAAFKTNSVSI